VLLAADNAMRARVEGRFTVHEKPVHVMPVVKLDLD
jgi:hypothetical protein